MWVKMTDFRMLIWGFVSISIWIDFKVIRGVYEILTVISEGEDEDSSITVPEMSYSSSEDEDFFDAEDFRTTPKTSPE